MGKYRSYLLSCAGALLPAAAYAAEPAAQQPVIPSSTSASSEPQTGEIIVTASKRAENLQNVPISVTAVTPARFQQLNVTSLTSLSGLAPSVIFYPSSPSPNGVQFVARGIGTFANADTVEQSVGVAIDGVPLGRIAGAVVDAVDIERVEVLRGPQGTVFGKSATGGLISIVTTKPVLSETQFNGRFYGGSRKEFRVEATANVPLIRDKLAFRLSAWNFSHDGYIEAPNQPDGNLGDVRNRGVRLRVGGKLTPDLRVDLTAEMADNRNDGVTQTTRSYVATDLLRYLGTGPTTIELNQAQGIYAGPYNKKVGSELAGLGGYVKPRFYHLDANWDLGPASVTFITALRNVRARQLGEFDYTNSQPNSLRTYQRYQLGTRQWTNELRLANNNRGPFTYTVGLFYYDFKLLDGTLEISSLRNPALTAPFAQGRQSVSNMHTTNVAGFADLGYKFHIFKLIGGVRLSREHSDGTYVKTLPTSPEAGEGGNLTTLFTPGTSNAAFAPMTASQKVTYKDFSWRGGLEIHPNDTTMLYATASRAYKGPGFNFGGDLTPALFATTGALLKPEIAHSYELGIRTQFFDKQLTFNLTGYIAPYNDFQIQAAAPGVPSGIVFTLINANEITAKGVEGDFSWRPRGSLTGLTVDGNFSYNDTRYTDFANAPCYSGQARQATPTNQSGVCAAPSAGSTASVQSVTGLRAVGAPKWQVNAYTGYERPIGPRLAGFVQGHFYLQSSTQYGVGANPATLAPGYHLFDLTLGVRSADNRWKLSLITKNVFHKWFTTRIAINNPGIAQLIPYEAVRSIGVALSVKM